MIKPTQVLSGIDLQVAPFLLGYVATQPRPTAEIFLVSDRGDPLLASWQYGLGKSVAFTSDAKARWASDWLEWPGYAKFWTQLVRDTMRKTTLSNFQAEIKQEKGNAYLAIDALGGDRGFSERVGKRYFPYCSGPEKEATRRGADRARAV